MNKTEQNSYENLGNKYKLAIDLRLLGLTYKKIASNPAISAKEHTIRTWFMVGGKCDKVYKDRVKVANSECKEFFREIETQIKDIAVGAVQGLRHAVEKGNLRAIFKSLELARIDRKNFIKIETHDDEGIKLLRKIIQEKREEVRKVKKLHKLSSTKNV